VYEFGGWRVTSVGVGVGQGVLMQRRVETGTHQVTAVFTQGKLLLAAIGTKVGDGQVFFEPTSLFGGTPTFSLRLPSETTAGDASPYRVAMVFELGTPSDEVIVDINGEDRHVPVLVAADGEALERRETVSLVPMSNVRQRVGRSTMPAMFAELLANIGEDVQPPLVWPIRLSALFEGRLEPAAADPRRAIGYSDTFDFTAAFLDALRSLPGESRGGSDQLTTVHVTATGALLGGEGGGRRLFVSILAY
jgi:hypothetical protein